VVDPVRLGNMAIIVDEFLSRADGDDTDPRDSRRAITRLIAEQGGGFEKPSGFGSFSVIHSLV
jgi:hypothetical protein